MGARSMALGYTSATLTDEWSIFNNIAGVAEIKDMKAGAAFHRLPGFSPFDRKAFAFVNPFNVGALAVGAFRFGDDLYNEQILTAGYANRFGIASLGLKANYIQYSAEGFGSKGVLSLSFGGITHFTKELSVGAYITNINQPSITNEETAETIPTIATLGIAFAPSESLMMATEVEKEIDEPLRVKFGVEYALIQKFILRSGFNLFPSSAFAGFGTKVRRISLDYAYQYHLEISSSHQISAAYTIHSTK